MVSLLEKGLRRHRDTLPEAAAGVPVEVHAATEVLQGVQAAPARRDFMQYAVGDAAGTAEVFDWIFAEQDLVFPIAGKIQPQAGWEIYFTNEAGQRLVFKVCPGAGTREFDVVDPLGLLYRVHTNFDRIE